MTVPPFVRPGVAASELGLDYWRLTGPAGPVRATLEDLHARGLLVPPFYSPRWVNGRGAGVCTVNARVVLPRTSAAPPPRPGRRPPRPRATGPAAAGARGGLMRRVETAGPVAKAATVVAGGAGFGGVGIGVRWVDHQVALAMVWFHAHAAMLVGGSLFVLVLLGLAWTGLRSAGGSSQGGGCQTGSRTTTPPCKH